ncbi:MAG: Ig-like domain repeat protein, partial [Acidimicrobiia bacterium]|nr:Ig-like domain repeat protein [Acidimicrobiia bacterium]
SAAFDPKSASLGQFASRVVQLRFRLSFDHSGGWSACCTEPGGWYFDNVAITGAQTVASSTVSPVGADPSFTLQNPQAGTVAIDVRPQFTNATFGSAVGGWSPAKVVTSVVPSASGTTLTSSANPTDGSQPVTFTAAVSPTSGDGTVKFTEDGTTIPGCAAKPLSAGKATCNRTYDSGGSHDIVATYSNDSSFSDSTSPTVQQVITAPQPVTGTLTSSDTSVDGGEPVTFTATVTPTDGGGTVTFTDNNTTIAGCGNLPLTASGQATCTMVSQGPEHALIEATYSGDSNFLGTSLGSLLQNVTAATSTAIASSANPVSAGVAVTYTATLTPVTSFGTISFTDNGNGISGCDFIAPDGSGKATCTVTYGSGGPHAVQALYSGWTGLGSFAPSTSPVLGQSVNALAASSTALVSSANPTTTGAPTTYTATVTASNLSGTVLFTDDGNPISGCEAVAVSGSGQAQCAQTYSDVGSHSIVATYSGTAGVAVSSSATVTETVDVPTALSALLLAVGGAVAGALQAAFHAPPAAAPSRALGAAATSSAISDVTGFNVYVGTTPGGESSTPVNSSRILATATGFTITGLTTGTRYYVVVRALNRGGLGAKSAELSGVPATRPTAPRAVTATAGDSRTTIGWTAPASNGGTAITGYNVYRGTTAGGEGKAPINATPLAASARTFVARGLTNTTRSYFVVRAINAVGTSNPSAEVSAVSAGPPQRPTYVVGYPGNGSAGLRWSAPDAARSSITGFNVYKGTTLVNASPLSRTTRSLTVSGLTNGTASSFTVRAVNTSGLSQPSVAVSVTPTAAATAPTPPRNLAASAGAGKATLTWSAPSSTGGKQITGYNVYKGTLPDAEGYAPINSSPLPASATSYTATGLANGAPVFFTVKAINSIGTSAASNEATTRPEAAATVPGAPRDVKVTAGKSKVTVSWSAPGWSGGRAVTGYFVFVGTTTGYESTTPVNSSPIAADATSYDVTGLTNGKRYFFVVKAASSIGRSAASNEESTTPNTAAK